MCVCVCVILRYASAKNALQENLDDDKKKPLSGVDTNSVSNYHEGKAVYISESDLYDLILRRKLPAAKSFKKWVTFEILKVKEMWKAQGQVAEGNKAWKFDGIKVHIKLDGDRNNDFVGEMCV